MNSRAGILVLAYAVVAVVGVTVLAVSAYYLWRLADLAGMPPALAWTLPVALDAGAIGATVCWVAAPGKARWWGQGIALGALAGTVSGNILAHLIDFQMLPVTPALVIGIGGVYPAVLWLMVHLALVLRTEQRDCDDAEAELSDARAVRARNAAEERAHAAEVARLRAAAEADADLAEQRERDAEAALQRREELVRREREQRTTPAPKRPVSASPKRAPARTTDLTTAVAWAVGELAAGESAGWRRIERECGLSEHQAKKAAQQAREKHEQRPVLTAVAKEA